MIKYFVLPVIGVAAVLYIKSEVVKLQWQLSIIRKEISKTQEIVSMLNLELSYLYNPVRIKNLADNLLKLSYIDSRQIIDNSMFAKTHDIEPIRYSTRGWRYKNPVNKYIYTSTR